MTRDFTHHLKSSPPLAPLLACVGRLERAGIEIALGGSGLLAALGLADRVRDWDLTTDAPIEAVRAALAGERMEHKGSDALHADQKLTLDGGIIEIIVGMAFHVAGGIVRIPTVVTDRLEGIPLGSPEAWAVAYALLERPEQSEALLSHLRTHGADPRRVERLRRDPLPREIADKLAALPHFK